MASNQPPILTTPDVADGSFAPLLTKPGRRPLSAPIASRYPVDRAKAVDLRHPICRRASGKIILIPLRPDVRRSLTTATGEFDTLSRRYPLLQSYRAPHIIIYLVSFNLHVAPKLVAISAVKEKHISNPEDSDTDN
jgi:hypothetical protein